MTSACEKFHEFYERRRFGMLMVVFKTKNLYFIQILLKYIIFITFKQEYKTLIKIK